MTLHKKSAAFNALPLHEQKRIRHQQENTPDTLRLRIAQRKAQRKKQEREKIIKLTFAALSSLCITLSVFLLSSYLYLN